MLNPFNLEPCEATLLWLTGAIVTYMLCRMSRLHRHFKEAEIAINCLLCWWLILVGMAFAIGFLVVDHYQERFETWKRGRVRTNAE